MIRRIFNYLQSLKKNKPVNTHPHTFLVDVRIEQGQFLDGSVQKFRISIDADSTHHARKRLREELRIVVGQAYMMRTNSKP